MSVSTILKKQSSITFKISLIIIGFMGFTWLTLPNSHVYAAEVTFNSARDCNNNAVVNCGAMSVNELQQKYLASSSTGAIYSCFGITISDIANIGNTAVAGHVSKNGIVTVNGQTVATNAITAGRQNISGSTTTTCNGTTFYKRPPSVSFISSSLDAFVVMKNGQFQYAILASCGNPVTATPTSMPTSTPTPTPVAPSSPTTSPPVTTQQLPNTGPGDIVGIFITTAIAASIGYRIFMTRRETAK